MATKFKGIFVGRFNFYYLTSNIASDAMDQHYKIGGITFGAALLHCNWMALFLATVVVSVLEAVQNSVGGIDLT